MFSGFNLGVKTGAINFNTVVDSPDDDYDVPESNISNTAGFIGINTSYLIEKSSYLYGIYVDANISNVSYSSTMTNGSEDYVNNKIKQFGSIRGLLATKLNKDSVLNLSAGIGLIKSTGNIAETETSTALTLDKNIQSLVLGGGISINIHEKLLLNAGVDFYLGKNYSIFDRNNDKVNVNTKILVPTLGVSYQLA